MIKLIDKIKLLFYKNNANDVMGILVNCEAYKNCQITKENTKSYIDYKLNDTIETLNKKIDYSIYKGEYSASSKYCIFYFTGKQLKYLRKIYEDKGYKVKIHLSFNLGKKIIISWKNWR